MYETLDDKDEFKGNAGLAARCQELAYLRLEQLMREDGSYVHEDSPYTIELELSIISQIEDGQKAFFMICLCKAYGELSRVYMSR